MSSPKEKPQVQGSFPQVNNIAYVFMSILDILTVVSVWDHPVRRWVTLGICFVLGTLNATLLPRLYRKKEITNNSFMLRELVNGFGQTAKIAATQAALPTWGWLFVLAIVVESAEQVWVVRTFWGLLATQVAAGIYFGIDPLQIATMSVLVVATIKLNEGRSEALVKALREQESQRKELERRTDELKQIQTLAVQQEKMSSLGMLAAGIAHEINNPMAFITSNINQLAADLPNLSQSDELRKEYMREVIPELQEGVVRVNTIVDDLRRFARGDIESRSRFDVNEVIRSAVRMTQGRAAPGVTVSLSLHDIPPQLGYPRQLSQVVINLLVNAVQAVADGGVVTIETDCDDGNWQLIVTDTGPGMDEETQTKIFDPFFTTKPLGEGTGLGLAVVHGIVEQQKGHIALKSKIGEGTVFTLTLPLHSAE